MKYFNYLEFNKYFLVNYLFINYLKFHYFIIAIIVNHILEKFLLKFN